MKVIIMNILLLISTMLSAQIQITTNTIWDGNDPQYPPPSSITGDITVYSGYSLTIKNWTMAMPDASKILITRNAKLIVDNVTIKAVNSEWKGIKCDNGTAQILITDRVPNININNSDITDAVLAFTNYYTDANSNTTYGGSILARSTTFKECSKFLELKNYTYYQKSLEYCSFVKCTFKETTTCLTTGQYIYLKNVKNAYFQGCYFENTCGSLFAYAIKAEDSKFSLRKYYSINSISINNKFAGFGEGINVLNNPSDDKVTVIISDCEFIPILSKPDGYNRKCINLNGCLNAKVISNKFELRAEESTLVKVAINMINCKSFTIEENEIEYLNTTSTTYGILIENSGIQTNQIYNNIINNATVGIQADGMNRGQIINPTYPNEGLKFLCNKFNNFSNSSYYIKVMNCNNTNSTYGVSRWQQGALNNAQGNAISGSPAFNSTPDRNLNINDDKDFYDEHTTVGSNWDIKYGYPTNPIDFTVRYVSKDNQGHKKIYFEEYTASIPSVFCESRLPGTGPFCPVVMGPQTVIAAFPQLASVKSQLTQLVNAGDHDILYNLVLNVSSSNLNDVYNELLNSNPSHDILALACENDLFSANMVEDILVENSYGIKSASVRTALLERENLLSQTQMDNIYRAAENISIYEDLLMQIDVINQEYTYLMNQSISALSNREIIPMDSIKLYLEAFNDLWSNIRLINIAFNEGNTTESQSLYQNLQNISDESGELEDYALLYNNVLFDIYTNHEGDFTQMSSTQKNDLYDFYLNGTYAAGVAKYLLIKHDNLEWELNYCEEGSDGSARKAFTELLSTSEGIRIYPNPANKAITIELPKCEIIQADIEIYDLSGRIVLAKTVAKVENQISVSELAAGTYFVKIIMNNNVSTQKLIISK